MQFIAGLFLGAFIGLIAGVWLCKAAQRDRELDKKGPNPIAGREYEP